MLHQGIPILCILRNKCWLVNRLHRKRIRELFRRLKDIYQGFPDGLSLVNLILISWKINLLFIIFYQTNLGVLFLSMQHKNMDLVLFLRRIIVEAISPSSEFHPFSPPFFGNLSTKKSIFGNLLSFMSHFVMN